MDSVVLWPNIVGEVSESHNISCSFVAVMKSKENGKELEKIKYVSDLRTVPVVISFFGGEQWKYPSYEIEIADCRDLSKGASDREDSQVFVYPQHMQIQSDDDDSTTTDYTQQEHIPSEEQNSALVTLDDTSLMENKLQAFHVQFYLSRVRLELPAHKRGFDQAPSNLFESPFHSSIADHHTESSTNNKTWNARASHGYEAPPALNSNIQWHRCLLLVCLYALLAHTPLLPLCISKLVYIMRAVQVEVGKLIEIGREMLGI